MTNFSIFFKNYPRNSKVSLTQVVWIWKKMRNKTVFSFSSFPDESLLELTWLYSHRASLATRSFSHCIPLRFTTPTQKVTFREESRVKNQKIFEKVTIFYRYQPHFDWKMSEFPKDTYRKRYNFKRRVSGKFEVSF